MAPKEKKPSRRPSGEEEGKVARRASPPSYAEATGLSPPSPPGDAARAGGARRGGPGSGDPGDAKAAPLFSGLRRSRDGRRLEFDVTGVDLGVVNSVRRAVLAEVPTAAFNYQPYAPSASGIIVHENTSVLHNEMLCSRVGLVPLGFDANQLRAFDPSQWRNVDDDVWRFARPG